jgi:uncharacterized protein DUF669
MTQLNYHAQFNRMPEKLPSGSYTVMFEECRERIATSGEDYLIFVWRIVEGEHAGRNILDNIYFHASQPDYKEKAMAKLDRICQIFGIEYLDNTDLLAQKKCQVHLGHRLNAQGQSMPYVRGYWPLPENQTPSEKKIAQNLSA